MRGHCRAEGLDEGVRTSFVAWLRTLALTRYASRIRFGASPIFGDCSLRDFPPRRTPAGTRNYVFIFAVNGVINLKWFFIL